MLCVIVSVLLMAAGALPGPAGQSDAWERMAASLVPGDTVVVELDGRLAATGRYVSSDMGQIVLWVGGAEQRLRRAEVARVIKQSRPYRRGALIGALLGAGIAGAVFASGEDLNAAGRAPRAPMRAFLRPLTIRQVAANDRKSALKASESGATQCCSVSVNLIPYCQRLLVTEIFPQKLSRRLPISILPASSGVA